MKEKKAKKGNKVDDTIYAAHGPEPESSQEYLLNYIELVGWRGKCQEKGKKAGGRN
jgi:hypothetical protein